MFHHPQVTPQRLGWNKACHVGEYIVRSVAQQVDAILLEPVLGYLLVVQRNRMAGHAVVDQIDIGAFPVWTKEAHFVDDRIANG